MYCTWYCVQYRVLYNTHIVILYISRDSCYTARIVLYSELYSKGLNCRWAWETVNSLSRFTSARTHGICGCCPGPGLWNVHGFASQLLDIEQGVPYSVQKQLTKLQSKMPLLVKASDHDLCPVQYICQFGVSLPIDSVPPCWWPWARSVIGRWTILFVHNIFKKVPCVLLRDGAANINPKLWVTICISDADLKKKRIF